MIILIKLINLKVIAEQEVIDSSDGRDIFSVYILTGLTHNPHVQQNTDPQVVMTAESVRI